MQTRSSDAASGPQTRSRTRVAEATSTGPKTRSPNPKPSVRSKILSSGKKALKSIKKYTKKSRKGRKPADDDASNAVVVSKTIVKTAAKSIDHDGQNPVNSDQSIFEGVNSTEEQEVAALLFQVDVEIVPLNDENLSESSTIPPTEGNATSNKRKRANDDEDDSDKPSKTPRLDDGLPAIDEASRSGSSTLNLKRKRSDDDLSDAPSAKTIRGEDGCSMASLSTSGSDSASSAILAPVPAPVPTPASVQNVLPQAPVAVAPILATPVTVVVPAPVPTVAAIVGPALVAPQAVASVPAPAFPMPPPAPVALMPQPAPQPNVLRRTPHFRIPVKEAYDDEDFNIRQWEF